MKTNHIKLFSITFFAMPLLALALFNVSPVKVKAVATDDPAAQFKAQCMMCHTATASKFFDPAKSDDEHVQTILKGKKGEKPPFMPGYEAKGMTAEGAHALAVYMKSLRTPAN